MIHWQGLIVFITIICTTYLMVKDKPWWGIILLVLVLTAVSGDSSDSTKKE